MRTSLALALAGIAGLSVACTESTAPTRPPLAGPASAPVVAPGHDDPVAIPLECVGDVARGTVRCRMAGDSATLAAAPAGLHRVIVFGGQGTYVNLASSNITYASGVFEMDVTVQNLIAQSLGTNDGTTPDGEGVRVFFTRAPVATSGSGTITIDNPDGFDAFTGANQAFYRYNGTDLGTDGILAQNEVSSSRHWRFLVPGTVNNFAFTVYVAANVQFPNGYVRFNSTVPNVLAGTTASTTPSVTVFTALGDSVPGATPTYSSNTPGVATVTTGGAITGVNPGKSTITATSPAGGTGTFVVSICPNLAVGEVYQATGAAAADVCFGGGAAVEEFTALPYNTSLTSSASITTTATNIQNVTGPPTPNRVPVDGPIAVALGDVGGAGSAQMLASAASDAITATAAITSSGASGGARGGGGSLDQLGGPISRARITPAVRMVWGSTGGNELPAPQAGAARGSQPVALGAVPRGGPARTITPGPRSVGDTMVLNVAQGCSGTPDNRTGIVRTVSQRAIIVSDTANPAGGFTTAQYDSIALEVDTIAYPVDTFNFGSPTDLDANGRIVLFYTRAVNELSPPATSATSFGYFTNRDVFSSDPVNGCTRSNEGEILYMMVPDPTGAVNSNVRTVSLVRGNTVRQIGHDLQHLINAFRRAYVSNAGAFEDQWLDEGLSQIAEELMFYRTSVGLTPGQNIVVGNLNTGPNASRRVAAFNTYGNPNFTNLRAWLQRPDTTGPIKAVLSQAVGAAARGIAWAFLRYAVDRFSPNNQQTVWRAIVDNPAVGRTKLAAVFGGIDLDAWQLDSYTALYADDNSFTVDPRFRTPSWNYRSVYAALGGVPIGTRQMGNATPLTLSYAPEASSFLRFGVAVSTFATFQMSVTGPVPLSSLRLSVVRTK